MDMGKLLQNITNLNEYIAITHESSGKCRNLKIQLNMSTVLALKKIRSFEVEYVNKCEDNGIASVIFERLLHLPPSKTWGVLSKEMVCLLQYWLDAVRKYLVKHSPHWWTFLKLLLRFLKEIRQKDSSLPDILVEHTAECLFDLATTEGPDVLQRYEILHCFNMYCSESSRELRFALRIKFGRYFTKLAIYMSGCGNLATQYSIMETLLRWLLPRQDRTLRITSASKWFPATLYADSVVNIFLERPWTNFFKDARDFLNAHNEKSDLITSVVCRKLTMGDIVIIRDTDKSYSWLDLNSSSKCISVLLDPNVLDAFGCTNHKSFETLVVDEENTQITKLYRESKYLTLSVQTISPPRVVPSCIKLGDDVSCHVTAVVSSRSDVKRLDGALRKIFDTKYQLLLDLEQEITEELLSPPRQVTEHSQKKAEEDTRFSNPVEGRRRKHSGYIVKPRQPNSCASPSTASTSSLIQLHEKVVAFPQYEFDKEPQGVCAPPDLSAITEVNEETDDRSTRKLNCKPYGVCSRKIKSLVSNRQSQSDSETSRKYPEPKSKVKGRQLSPVVREDTPSCLLVATIGSAEDSVINDTVERLSKSKDYNPDNIVNLLVQEALNAKLEKEKDQIDSGIKTKDITIDELNNNNDIIDNRLTNENDLNKSVKQLSKVFSSSDESNTEAISDTPNVYVNNRRKNKNIPKSDSSEKKCFDIQVVEDFFSQHFTENREQVTISPTLAKKINESSSEYSGDDLDHGIISMEDDIQNLDSFNFNNVDVIECLNNIVDRVCEEFNKCSEYLNADQAIAASEISDLEDNLPLKDIQCNYQNTVSKNTISLNKKSKTPNKMNSKFKTTSNKDNRRQRATKQKKKESKQTTKMSTIIEDSTDTIHEGNVAIMIEKNTENNKIEIAPDNGANAETPLLRRKRKLYSPKDVKIIEEVPLKSQDNDFIDSKVNKTPTSVPSYKPYKDLERERKKYIRMPRNRKSKLIESPSPRSKKNNDLFDKIKEFANCEQVRQANKADEVYNFSTDSEDDFKQKIEISKRNSTTTNGAEEGATVLRRGRVVKRVNYSGKKESKNNNSKINKRQRTKKKVADIKPANELIDERMRKKNEVLDTSVVVDVPQMVIGEPELVSERNLQMESITEKAEKSNKNKHKGKITKKNKAKRVDLTKAAEKPVVIKNTIDNDSTESPLPGLVVEETLTKNKEDGDLSTNMVDKFKKICRNPEKYINESNTTQNQLSDHERMIYSPQTIDLTDECTQLEIQTKLSTNSKKPKEKRSRSSVRSGSKSDESIATVGITGHGDSGEAPPSPKLIMEPLPHRNLETEYLDTSTKDYFEKLTNDVNVLSQSNSKETNRKIISQTREVNTNSKSNNSSVSPVVSIERISLEDISRWLPSRRNSESDFNSSVSNKTKRNGDIESSKATAVKHSDSENDPCIFKAVQKPLRVMKEKSKFNADTESNIVLTEDNVSRVLVNRTKSKDKAIENTSRVLRPRPVKSNTFKSNISPIKLFDNVDKLSHTSLSDDENYMDEIRKTISKTRTELQSNQSSIEKEQSVKKVIPKKKMILDLNKNNEQENFSHSSESESVQDKISTSTKIFDSRNLKRKMSDDIVEPKRKKVLGDFNSGSGITVSTVDDWFKRNEPSSSRAGASINLLQESIQNVNEKLDTTLTEINQNTSRKLVHLFMKADLKLRDMALERENMYKQEATNLLSEMVRTIDDKFIELNKRSQAQHDMFRKFLKDESAAVIRADCIQKRIMLQLLKEDIQSIIEHAGNSTE